MPKHISYRVLMGVVLITSELEPAWVTALYVACHPNTLRRDSTALPTFTAPCQFLTAPDTHPPPAITHGSLSSLTTPHPSLAVPCHPSSVTTPHHHSPTAP